MHRTRKIRATFWRRRSKRPSRRRLRDASHNLRRHVAFEPLEDRRLLTTWDFGDAPADYPTRLADDGARHILDVPGPRLGVHVDAEDDGLPDMSALGDDAGGTNDDEDGAVFATPLTPGFPALVDVDLTTSPAAGLLNAWIDFDGNGSWADAGEQIFVDQQLAAGFLHKIEFDVPAGAAVGGTFARFRLSSQAGLSWNGEAADGEVEDHAVEITLPGSIRGSKWYDANADGVWDDEEPPMADWPVYVDLNHNGRHDAGEPSAVTAGDGTYEITGLAPGDNIVAEELPGDWQATTAYGDFSFVQHLAEGQVGLDGLDLPASLAVSPDGEFVYVANHVGSTLDVWTFDEVTGYPRLVQSFVDEQYGIDNLGGAAEITLSPDARHIYVAAYADEAITVFQRNELSGTLALQQVVEEGLNDVDGLIGVNALVVSPTGDHLYAGSYIDGSVAVFHRDAATGQLTFVESHRDGLLGLNDVAISPDGEHVYAVGFGDDSVATYDRDTATGSLTFVEVQRGGQGGLVDFDAPTTVVVSPDGAHVYVGTFQGDSAVTLFQRDETSGQLSLGTIYRGREWDSPGVTRIYPITISTDGYFLYIGGYSESLAVLTREAATGELSLVARYGNDQQPYPGLGNPVSIVISPDGQTVYTAGSGDDEVGVYGRDSVDGRLTPQGAIVDWLRGVTATAVSPDGKHVYAAAPESSTVTIFARNGVDGQLQVIDRVQQYDAGIDGLLGVSDVVLDPSGNHVYVAGRSDDALTVFDRDDITGELTLVQTVWDSDAGAEGLDDVVSLVMSPGGEYLYAGGGYGDSIAVFARDLASGELSFVQVLRDGQDGVDGLDVVYQVAMSPDGNHVYAVGADDNAVVSFTRDDVTGELNFSEVYRDGVDGFDGLDGAAGVTVAPDGRHVIVCGTDEDAVSVLARDETTGRLTPVAIYRDEQGSIRRLNGARSAAVTPDGRTVLVVSYLDDSVTTFARDPESGELTYQRAYVGQLDNPLSVTVSPDGANHYVSSRLADSVTVFFRDMPDRRRVTVPASSGIWNIDFGNVLPDQPPTDLTLSNTTVPDNRDAGTWVGGFVTVDSNLVDGFTYELVAGAGDDDNAAFLIDGSVLKTAAAVDYETQDSYSIRARTTDSTGLLFERVFTITVTDEGEDDFGDAPAPYPTLAAAGGARHTVTVDGPRLGVSVDAEIDGQPSDDATGDDRPFNDENGITFTSPLTQGFTASVAVDMCASPADGLFNAWLDFNGNGSWDDANEHVFADVAFTAGSSHTLDFDVPPTAVPGTTFVRFRLSTAAGLSFTGHAPDGEVEDYAVEIAQPGEIVGSKWNDLNGNGVWDAGEPALPDGTVFLDLNQNDELDPGEPRQLTDANGRYRFTNLVPGQYTVAEQLQPGWIPTSDDGRLSFASRVRDGEGGVTGLRRPYAVAVSPDSRNVYVLGNEDGSLVVFARDASSGELTFVEKFVNGQDGMEGLGNGLDVVVSPDGRHVYASTGSQEKVSVFQRDLQSGQLSLVQHVYNNQDGVEALPVPRSIALSPDGAHLYAVSYSEGALSVLARDAATGRLTAVEGLYGYGGSRWALLGATNVTVSPDGHHVYVTKDSKSYGMAVFARDAASGRLGFLHTLSDDWSQQGLSDSEDVALSPDGRHVYVACWSDVAVFSREPATNSLTFVQMLEDAYDPAGGFTGNHSISVSPSGDQVFVGVNTSSMLVVFDRDAVTGRLTFVQQLQDGVDGADGFERIRSVTVSPDGLHVLATSYSEHAVTVWSRVPQTGQLAFVETIRDDQGGAPGVMDARSVAVAPDGGQVYVTGWADDVLAVFSRTATNGELLYAEGHRDGFDGVDGMWGPNRAVLSPDGRHVYVAGYYDSAIVVFGRSESTGLLTFQESIVIDPVGSPEAITFSSDGNYVYAAIGTRVVVFTRNSDTGGLTFEQAVEDGVDGVMGLSRAASLDFSPDDDHLYAGCENALLVFARDASTGHLTYVETHEDELNGADGLRRVRGVAVSPDGAHVYTAASLDDAVTVFARDSLTGQLTLVETIRDGDGDVAGLHSAISVEVTADGGHVYVAAGDGVVMFDRDSSTGRLNFAQLMGGGADGLVIPGAVGTRLTPNEKHLYVAADDVTVLHRDRPGFRRVDVDAGQAVQVDFGNQQVVTTLTVTGLEPTERGFVAHFSLPIDASLLNLYDVEAGTWGPADVTVVGDTLGPVTGSLVLADDSITFVAADGLLLPDNYTVTFRSAADGFVNAAEGELLDGNSDGTPADDYVGTFVVAAPELVVVSLPDFSRGPDQTIDVPATHPGLPLLMSETDGLQTFEVTVTYDPALLTVTAADPGPDMPAGTTVDADLSLPGRAVLTFASPAPLGAGSAEVITLTAEVPDSASYGSSHMVGLSDLSINGGAISAMAVDAIHAVAYLGDATGNQGYSGLDAQRVARVAVSLDAGFAAYPCIDPFVIADVTGNGDLSGLDAQRIAQQVVGLEPEEIPPLPGQVAPQRLAEEKTSGVFETQESRRLPKSVPLPDRIYHVPISSLLIGAPLIEAWGPPVARRIEAVSHHSHESKSLPGRPPAWDGMLWVSGPGEDHKARRRLDDLFAGELDFRSLPWDAETLDALFAVKESM